MHSIYVGRQPIYDRDLNVYAYELLYRGGEHNQADFPDGDTATSQVILNTFLDIGLNQIVGHHPAFINMTRNFLVGTSPLPLPPERVVLEILEDIDIDPELVAAISALAASGYRIALDDFVYHDTLRPLVEVADIIKIDLMALDRTGLKEHVSILQNNDAILLAEKVETQEDYEFCRELGFDLFQGFFFCRPNVIKGQRIPANRLATLQLLSALQQPDSEVKELEKIISQDVSLSYRLLRLINSAFYSPARPIESIRQAVVYLGSSAIKNWATLLSLAKIENKPDELITTALVRAKMCELFAQEVAQKNQDSFFTVGLFSTLDAMIDAPMDEIISSLPLAEEITAALLRHEGSAGQALACVLAYEHGDWEQVEFEGLDSDKIQNIYLQAVTWADELTSAINS